MRSAPELTLAFLRDEPASAARALEALVHDDAAAFLKIVPAYLAGRVVERMVPWSAARCLALLPPERAGTVLRSMVYQDGTSLLRLMPGDRVSAIMDHLPRRLARDYRNSLRYPRNTVGAWMDQSVPTFSTTARVADGLVYVRRRHEPSVQHIFAVDRNREFAGAVGVSDLVRSDPATPLSAILERDVQPLSNRATVAAVAAVPGWDEYPMLPVVGRKRNVLGGLRRSTLRKALADEGGAAGPQAAGSVLSHLFASYLATCAGLFDLVGQAGADTEGSTIRKTGHERTRRKGR